MRIMRRAWGFTAVAGGSPDVDERITFCAEMRRSCM